MFAIYRKELKSYFITPMGYIYIGIFMALSALLFSYTTFMRSSYDVTSYFSMMIFAFVVLIPLLTMKLFAEEKKLRTEQMLLTAPVTITGMVMGKYLAALTMFVGSILCSCINFIPLYAVANVERAEAASKAIHIGPSGAQIIGSLIGIILVGAAFIAVGMFISTLTENQLASAVISVAVLLLMIVLGFVNNFISNYAVRFVIDWISVLSRFAPFGYGRFDFAALLYYLSLTSVFIFFTVRVYEKRRWG
ncbi:MAG: ABC transporter permease [Clostridia bacterium]|nr:ABC transporter permease [Clostridia bacterium]